MWLVSIFEDDLLQDSPKNKPSLSIRKSWPISSIVRFSRACTQFTPNIVAD